MVWLLPSRSNSCSCSARRSLGCNFERQIADLVEKQRTPIRELESPLGLRARARESASFVAEEFTLQQCTWNCGAVQGNEWPLPSRTLVSEGRGR